MKTNSFRFGIGVPGGLIKPVNVRSITGFFFNMAL